MDSFSLVLFGATGDLARLKIIPAVYELKKRNLLPEGFSLIGNGRTQMNHEKFREYVLQVWEDMIKSPIDVQVAQSILEQTYYIQGDLHNDQLYQQTYQLLEDLLDQGVRCGNRIFHLAILPDFYQTTVEKLGKHNLSQSKCGWVRLLVEKPFGNNLETAHELDSMIKKYFSEDQTYRIDHYLAKETVQNILAFRFANEMFEPTLNKNYIDHIQITMLEEFGIKDRGKFYDRTGTVRDVLQNHLLQVLASVTMDKPEKLESESIRSQRQKILSEFKKLTKVELNKYLVKGQYQGYLKEKFIEPNSITETFVAMRGFIDNPRWQGVPFYIRTGKGLCKTVTEVNVVYKDTSLKPSANVLTFRIMPDESIVLRFFVTKPGPTNDLEPANLEFNYRQLGEELMAAYQRVLLDAFRGDQTLFTQATGVEAEWKFVDPILNYWEENQVKPITYPQGSWGPEQANKLIAQDNRAWIDPSIDL